MLADGGLISRVGVAGDRQRKIALWYREGLAHENKQLVLGIVESLLALVKLWVVGIVVFCVLPPRPSCSVRSRSRGGNATIGIQAQARELREGVGVPVERQLRSAIEAVAMVIGSASERLYGLVEVLEDLSPMLESPSFVIASPSFPFPFSFTSPSPILAFVSPSLCDEPASNASGQGARYADTGYYEGHPKRCSAHASMMEPSTVDLREAGHIEGTSHRDLL